ncbi:hypothetical protein Tco_0014199 [Tanacetum coccineum]
MYHNLNQLQWQLKRENLHSCDPKNCLDVLRTSFKKTFDSNEVNASDFPNKCWQNNFKDYTRYEPETYRCNLLWYLDVLDKLIDERILKYEELQMKEREVQAINTNGTTLDASSVTKGTTLEACLVTEGTTLEACLVTKGVELDASLVTKGITMDDNLVAKESTDDSITLSEQLDESISSGNETDAEKTLVDTVASDIENDDIEPSYNSDTMSEVHHDTFENVIANEIQSHEQPDSISDTYVVNENNSDIISDIPNMNPDRGKEEHDYVAYEHQLVFFASLIKNLKCDVEKFTKINYEAMENGTYDEYVQPLLKMKNELEKKNQEFFNQINDIDNKLHKTGQTAKTLHMLFPKEDSVLSKSDEAKIKSDTEDLETINIELEYSVTSLLKENEHLKTIYQDMFDSIKSSRGEDGERMWYSITKEPYVRPKITDPDDPDNEIPEPLSKMTEANKKCYSADVRVINYLLQSIPNHIYNSVDACKDAQKM